MIQQVPLFEKAKQHPSTCCKLMMSFLKPCSSLARNIFQAMNFSTCVKGMFRQCMATIERMSMQSAMHFSVQREQIPPSCRQLVMLCISTSWERTTKLRCGSDLWNSFKSSPLHMVMAGFQRRAPWKLVGWSSPLPPKIFYKQLAASANQGARQIAAAAAVVAACN